jgi:ribosome-associated protein
VEAIEKARLAGQLAQEKKAKDVLIVDLKGLTDIADYFLVASATSERHVLAVAEHVEKALKDGGIRPYAVEGYKEARWVIMDYGSFVIHIFLEQLRDLYDLEGLWMEAKKYRVEKENKNTGVGDGERKA